MLITRHIKYNWHYFVIGLTALVTHGLILLNDGIYWDGWLIHDFLGEQNWINLSNLFTEAGLPIWTYLHWGMGYLPDVIFGYHFIAFVCIAASGFLIYRVGCLSGYISQAESLQVALISLAYPAFRVAFELIILPYMVSYALFWLAVLLALLAEQKTKLTRIGLRLSALAGFLVSFNISSFLVYYFGFLLLLAVFVRRLNSLSIKDILTRFLPRNLDYILLPFLYWVLKQVLFPRYGFYASYNEFTTPSTALLSLTSFLSNGIYEQFNDALRELLTQPAFALLGFIVIWWGMRYIKPGSNNQFVKPYPLLAFGIFLLGLGIFPYVVVGLKTTVTGWSTRHSLLLAMPVALIIVAITKLLFSTPSMSLSKSGWLFLGMLFLAFSLVTVTNYVGWQARWIKDRSIMLQLSKMDDYKGISVFWVDDHFDIGGESYYRFYEWSSLFENVWGKEAYIGLDLEATDSTFLATSQRFINSRYNLSAFDPLGCQALLIIHDKQQMPFAEMVLRYFYFKFFQPQQMNTYLAGVALVEIKPTTSVAATHCSILD